MEIPQALDDTLLHDIPAPRRAMFFPLGFPLEITTNSDAVIAAARQMWGHTSAEHEGVPISLTFMVTEHEGARPPVQPTFRIHQHLMSIVVDARNHVMCDFSRGCAFGWVTRPVAEQPEFLRTRFLEPAVMSMLVAAHLAPIHGALVARNGAGLVLCGESFAGKSTLAYACARSGWTLISDDGTFLVRRRADRFAVGNPKTVRFRPDAKRLFPELADFMVGFRPNGMLGMEVPTLRLPVTAASGCSIDHVVFLKRSRAGRARITPCEPSEALRQLEDVTLYGLPEGQDEQRRAYRRLLDGGLWWLHYSDLDEAVQELGRLGTSG